MTLQKHELRNQLMIFKTLQKLQSIVNYLKVQNKEKKNN